MSAEIINLRAARKARERRAKEAAAEENRAKFGLSKADKAKAAASDDLARRRHEEHRLPALEGGGRGEGAPGERPAEDEPERP